MKQNHKSKIMNHRSPRHRGLSLIELLIALAITSMLLTATMVAIDASFQAYAAAAETASTQTATRMVVNRLLTLMRTSTAHGPLLDDPTDTPPVVLLPDGNTIESYYLTLLNPQGDLVRIEYRAADQELWLIIDPADGSAQQTQPIMGGVTDAKFYTHRRVDNDGVLVLERGSIDMTVVADDDASLALEGANLPPIRVIASTMPRKLE
jgi:prepilin-type N-terminal cleavage/methylation domain-containing protein